MTPGTSPDPDLLYHHIEQSALALSCELERAHTHWETILADAEGLMIGDGEEWIDLVSCLRCHSAQDGEGQR